MVGFARPEPKTAWYWTWFFADESQQELLGCCFVPAKSHYGAEKKIRKLGFIKDLPHETYALTRCMERYSPPGQIKAEFAYRLIGKEESMKLVELAQQDDQNPFIEFVYSNPDAVKEEEKRQQELDDKYGKPSWWVVTGGFLGGGELPMLCGVAFIEASSEVDVQHKVLLLWQKAWIESGQPKREGLLLLFACSPATWNGKPDTPKLRYQNRFIYGDEEARLTALAHKDIEAYHAEVYV